MTKKFATQIVKGGRCKYGPQIEAESLAEAQAIAKALQGIERQLNAGVSAISVLGEIIVEFPVIEFKFSEADCPNCWIHIQRIHPSADRFLECPNCGNKIKIEVE